MESNDSPEIPDRERGCPWGRHQKNPASLRAQIDSGKQSGWHLTVKQNQFRLVNCVAAFARRDGSVGVHGDRGVGGLDPADQLTAPGLSTGRNRRTGVKPLI